MTATSLMTHANDAAFKQAALELFRQQYENIKDYNLYCKHLGKSPENVQELSSIPFLPIQFFKSKKLITEGKIPEIVFTSSGTTGTIPSKHYVASEALYQESFLKGFELVYGPVHEWVILALLPSYMERGGSSLVYMFDKLIQKTKMSESGFYLDDYENLIRQILELEQQGRKTILLGVSYALLDLLEIQNFQLRNTIVMETGGMKGRRKELVKEALHGELKKGFGVSEIHSEYGMTELLSQAYSKGNGIYRTPPWMRILTRDTEDPFHYVEGTTGGINVIDLANIYSCAFIETQDLGKLYSDGSFEILGRFDNTDIRGCNLMVL